MEIIKGIDQRSDEWYKLRMGIPTASEFSKIITPKLMNKSSQFLGFAYQKASERIMIDKEESYMSFDMQQGAELEPEALDRYCELKLVEVEEATIILGDNCGYSPDGLVGGDGLIEIKCPKSKKHMECLYTKEADNDYMAQLQGALYVSGRKWIDFVSYNTMFKPDKQLFVKRVYRDEVFISKLKALLLEFEHQVKEILKVIG